VEREALAAALKDLPHEAFLFGSRCDDAKRGGDVDILILARGLNDDERLALELRTTARFQAVCDEKVDVVVLDPVRLTPSEQAFLSLISAQKIPLAA
jgi:predicted nucleotidyltransferase